MKNTVKQVVFWGLGWLLGAFAAQAQGPTLDPSFAITSATGRLNPAGPTIDDMVRQPDGKLIVTGDLATVNGSLVNKLCRLLPDGQVDATFNAPPTNGDIFTLALQADGKLLIGGDFANVDGQPRIGIARLLPDGTLDSGFQSPFGSTPTFSSLVRKVVIQPGLGLLVLGVMIPPGTGMGGFYLARLTEATGALDATFRPGFDAFDTQDALVQPNGHLVLSGRPRPIGTQQCVVWGALPNGALDPAFVPLPGSAYAHGLVRDPRTGNLYVAGAVPGTALIYDPVRLLPNGTRDPSFNAAGAFVVGGRQGYLQTLVVQPNGRLLLAGDFAVSATARAGSWRLLPSGARDFSYQPGNGPSGGNGAGKVLVQPDGALVFAGDFTQAGGFALNCLARMLDPNVLSSNNQQAAADDLLAWPVPAHDVLHMRLPAARRPKQVALLDALGRVVLLQALADGQAAPSLPTAGLPPGSYLLRVGFASGPPAYRRVAVE